MANKIWPNTTSKVPDEYLDAIEAVLGWSTIPESSGTGAVAATEGIWYDFGVVNQGFDNNGDLVPDYNAWAQPVGDPTLYDASCFRLLKTYGLLIVKINDGTELLIPFEDQLYFEHLPTNNTGVVGLVFYEYIAVGGPCTVQLSPYQEVASGSDNEKFNADFGSGPGLMSSLEPEISFDKGGSLSVALGGTIDYTLSATNDGADPVGFPALAMPMVFHDTIPAGTTYVADSAAAGNGLPAGMGVTVLYSTDNKLSWATTQPGDPTTVTDLQWWLDAALSTGETATVTFQVNVPATYPDPTVPNTGGVGFGPGDPSITDDHLTFIAGTLTIGDTVFADDGNTTGIAGNGIQDGDEVGLANINVTLYVDLDGNGIIDADDLAWGTLSTDGTGAYAFNNLPDGNYIAVVERTDPDRPTGWGMTTVEQFAVTLAGSNYLDADFGFGPALVLDKELLGTDPIYEGDEVVYTLDVTNLLVDSEGKKGRPNTFEVWAGNVRAGTTMDNPERHWTCRMVMACTP